MNKKKIENKKMNKFLPKKWKKVKLGEVLTFQRGYDLPKEKMCSGKVPVAGSNGIIGYHNTKTTNGPGVTIGRSGSIGKPTFYKNDFWAHNTALYVKNFYGNDEKFIFYLIQGLDLSKFNSGSAVPTLNRNHIHELKVIIPSLIDEQKRIVEILSTWDQAIEKLDKLISAKEKEFKWFSNKLLYQKEWSRVKLGDVCILEYGKPLKEGDRRTGENPVFGSNGIVGYHNTYLVKGPFIIVGRKGTAGSITYSERNGYPIDTTFYIKFRNKNKINIQFFFYILKTLDLRNMNKQTGVPGLNRNDAYKIKLPLPLLGVQKEIAIQLSLFEKSILLLKNVTRKYEQQKKGLMQQLLTGKIRFSSSFPRKRESRKAL